MDEDTVKAFLEKFDQIGEQLESLRATTEESIRELLAAADTKCQSIQARVKKRSSLQSKLQSQTFTSLEAVQDLIGLRFVFYLESDVDRFLNLLHDNLEQLGFERVEYYEKRFEDGFNGRFLILKLSKTHPEYIKFKKFRFEIQVTSALFHAWNEVYHESVYKKESQLTEYDAKTFESIKSRFQDVMSNQLKEASRTLEYLSHSAKKLIASQKVFEKDSLDVLKETDDLNELYFGLDTLTDTIREHGLKIPEGYDFLSLLDQIVARVPSIKVKPHVVSGYELEGRSPRNVLRQVIEVLDQVRYHYPDRVVVLLKQLWRIDESLFQEVKNALGNLTRYDQNVIPQVGYGVQKLLIQHISELQDEELRDNQAFYIEILEDLLELRLEGVRRTGAKSFSFPISAPPVHSSLEEVRSQALDELIRMYRVSPGLKEQLRTIRSIGKGKDLSYTPGGDSAELKEMVLNSARKVFSFYSEIVEGCHPVILKEIEDDVRWFLRNFDESSVASIKTLKEALATNEEYQVFRTFVGLRGDYDEGDDWRESERRRKEKLTSLASQFPDTIDDLWSTRIQLVLTFAEVDGRSGCEGFNNFLRILMKLKPSCWRGFCKDLFEKMDFAVFEMLMGLENAEAFDELRQMTEYLLENNLCLESVATGIGYSQTIFETSYESLKGEAFKKGNEKLTRQLIFGMGMRSNWTPEAVSDVITFLRELGKTSEESWTQLLGFKEEEFAAALDRESAEEMLGQLVKVPRLQHNEYEVLIILANKYPDLIIPFFEKRVLFQDDSLESMYYALPSDKVSELRTAVGNAADVTLSELLTWFSSDVSKLKISAPFLFNDLFSLSNEKVSVVLSDYVEQGGEKLKVVMSLLLNHSGSVTTHGICKLIAKKHSKNKEVIRSVMGHLLHVSSWRGDDGRWKMLEGLRDSVLAWDDENDPKLKRFLRQFERYANQMIDGERESVQKDRKFEELEYDDYLKASGSGD